MQALIFQLKKGMIKVLSPFNKYLTPNPSFPPNTNIHAKKHHKTIHISTFI